MSNGFVANDGQLPPSVQFEADLGTGMLHLFADGFNLNLPNIQWEQPDPSNQHTKRPQISKRGNPHDVRLAFVGSNRTPQLVARDRLTATLSDYRGDDQSKWRRDLSQYASVSYHDLYPNIMLDYTLDTTGGFKSTYVVAPHGDPTLIRWRYQGVQDVAIAPDGSLVLTLPPRVGFATRTLTESAPLAWQDVNGDRVFVPVQFQISKGKQVSFRVGQYDPAVPLVIDPTLTVGYTQTGVYFEDVATHPDGSFYVVGYTINTTKLWHLNANGSVTDVRSFGYSYDYATAIAIGGDGTIATISGTSGTGTPMHPTVNEDVLVTMWVANGTPSTTRIHMGGDLSGYMYLEMQRMSQRIVVSYFGIEYTPTGGIGHNYLATLVNGSLTSIEELASNADVVGVDSTGATLITLSGNLVRRPIGGSWQTIATLGSVVAWNLDQTTDIVTIVDTQNSTGSGFVRLRSYTNTGGVRWSYTLPANEPYNPFSDVAMLSDGSVLAVGWSDSTSLPIVGSTTVINPNERGIYWAKIAANGSGITASDMVYPAINYYWFDVAVAVNAVDTAMLGIYTQNGNNSSRASYVATLDFGVAPQTLPEPPQFTKSYYIQSMELEDAHELGCKVRKDANNGAKGVVILAFGSPRITRSGNTTSYGVKLVALKELYTLKNVYDFLIHFIQGYVFSDTSFNGFTCTTSISGEPPSSGITLGISISNSAVNQRDNPALNRSHGYAWSKMLTDLNVQYLRKPNQQNGITRTPRDYVSLSAGYDAEYIHPAYDDDDTGGAADWTSYEPETRWWLEGYNLYQQANAGEVIPYYFFGSCESCPREGTPQDWSAEHMKRIYNLAFNGTKARSLPQIYHASYPNEWYNVRWYLNTDNDPTTSSVLFNGVMTQCGQSGCSGSNPVPYQNRIEPFNCGRGGSCSGQWLDYNCTSDPCPNFPPSRGWQALSDTIRSTKTPYGVNNPALTPQLVLRNVTDITCQPNTTECPF